MIKTPENLSRNLFLGNNYECVTNFIQVYQLQYCLQNKNLERQRKKKKHKLNLTSEYRRKNVNYTLEIKACNQKNDQVKLILEYIRKLIHIL